MGHFTNRRGKLPQSEINKIFKTVSYSKFGHKSEAHYNESPPGSSADALLEDFYRMDGGALEAEPDAEERSSKKEKPKKISTSDDLDQHPHPSNNNEDS